MAVVVCCGEADRRTDGQTDTHTDKGSMDYTMLGQRGL